MNKIEQEQLAKKLIDQNYTMIEYNLFEQIMDLKENIENLDGDIIECGVCKGGFSIFLAKLFPEKNIWVCDSFQGFQPLSNATYEYLLERHVPDTNYLLKGDFSLKAVKERFIEYGLNEEHGRNIFFAEGFVKDVLPKCKGLKKLALLRIDVDSYSAILETLDELYDSVVDGGYIIFDDTCLHECINAMYTFFRKRKIPRLVYHPNTHQILHFDRLIVEAHGNKLHLRNVIYKHPLTDSGYPAGLYIIKNDPRLYKEYLM